MTRSLGASALALGLALLPSATQAQGLARGVAGDVELQVFDLGLANLTAAEALPDGRVVLLQQDGQVFVWDGASPSAVAAGALPVRFDGGERGLLGLAVDPEFARTGRLYVYYSAAAEDGTVTNRVAWVRFDAARGRIDPTSRTEVLAGIHAPRNHDGGGLAFGPDGYLYVGAGDTGCNCGCAPGLGDNVFATCLTNLNGKLLRVDRDGVPPAGNPLVGVGAVTACGPTADDCRRPLDPGVTAPPSTAIYAWGFRNPWRFSFDPATGWLWIGDVGEVTWEEITVSKRPGEHHGWPLREGRHGQDPGTCLDFTPNAAGGGCVDPVFEYPHGEGPGGAASVTGGVFSSHCAWPEGWRGRYWFGDYAAGTIWTLTPNATRDGVVGERTTIVNGVDAPVHFFVLRDGSIAWVSHGGSIGRLAPAQPVACPEDGGTAAPGDARPSPDDARPSPDDARPNPDGDAAGAPGDASAGPGDAGVRPAAAGSGGCGCGATAPSDAAPWALGALGALAAAYGRRRR